VQSGLWKGRTLYDLYTEAHTPWEWHAEIFSYARKLGLEVFSTPFDKSAVEFLEDLSVSTYKIASFELTDHSLLRVVAETKKPIIMSTGMASREEISESLDVLRKYGSNDICLLYCVSGYPTPIGDANLLTMPLLAKEFDVVCGFSDHTLGSAVSVAATALGASVIEKHFTLSRSDGGPDAVFSVEPQEFQKLVSDCKAAWEALGKAEFRRKKSEQSNLIFRRSLYAVQDIKSDEIFTSQNVRIIRPGYGMPPKDLDNVLGQKASQFIKAGTPIVRDLVK
jgi:N-acetylneuraminate synthase